MKKIFFTLFLLSSIVMFGQPIIVQWNFDDDNLVPNINNGSGTASNIGETTSTFAQGTPTSGRGWNTSNYAAQSTNNGTSGVQFSISTVGYENILLTFDHRASGTASSWARVDYSLNGGSAWTNGFWDNNGGLSPHDTFRNFSVDFSSVEGVNNNPNFIVRIVSFFAPCNFRQNNTLTYDANTAYMRANNNAQCLPHTTTNTGNYGITGTWRFDNVTFRGNEIMYRDVTATGSWNTNSWNGVTDGPTYTSPFSAGSSVVFTSGSYSFAGMGAALNVGNITVNSGANVNFASIGNTFATGGNVRTIDVASGSVLDFNTQSFSTTAGTGFIKNGAGVLAIAGNTYNGGFTLNAGTVIIRGINAMGGGTGNVLNLNGGTVSPTANNRNLSGKYTAGINIGGNVQFGEFPSNISIAGETHNLTFDNNINLQGARRTITLGNRGNMGLGGVISNGSLTFGANTGAEASVTGNGRFDITNTANTFTGAIEIFGPEVRFTADGSMGNAGNTIVIDGGRFATVNSGTFTTSRNIFVGDIAGTSISTPGTGTFTLSSPIANITGKVGSWAKQGGGTLVLSGVSTYTGNTSINNGIVQLNSGDNRLPIGTTLSLGQASSDNLGTLDMNGRNQTVAGLNSTAGTNTSVNKNTITSAAAATLTINGGGSFGAGTNANSGVITGAISLVKNGTATLTLGDANTYSGTTTINAGELMLNRTGGTTIPATSNVIINGGTLRISSNQTLNNLTLNAGATLILDANLTINGTFNYNVGGTISGTGTVGYGGSGVLIYSGSGVKTATNEWPATTNRPSSLTITNDVEIILNQNKTMNTTFVVNGTLDASTFSISGTGTTVNLNGIVKTANPNGICNISVSGATFTGYTTAASFSALLGSSSTIEYYASVSQTIQGTIDYVNLIVTNESIKTPSSVLNISGTLTIKNNATLNGIDHNIGGIGTNFNMSSGRLIVGTSGTQPNMTGSHSITGGTVEFAGISGKTIRSGNYHHIDISGDNVNSVNLTLANNTTFRILEGGVYNTSTSTNHRINAGTNSQVVIEGTFRVGNETGFSGNSNEAVSLGNTISFGTYGTVDYYISGDQTITTASNYNNLTLTGSGDKTFTANQLFVDKDLSISGSANFLVDTNQIVHVEDNFLNSGGTAIFENGSSLMQTTGTTSSNSGNINYKRTTRGLKHLDFVYWGSMVEGQAISNMWMSNASENFCRFDPSIGTAGNWVGIPGSFVMQAGQGYIARARHNSNGWAVSPPGAVPWDATLVGKPRSGDVSLSLTSDRFHLLGNPYPSAVDFDVFALQNQADYESSPFIPTIYYWTQSTPITGNQYNQNDYAAYSSPLGTGNTVGGYTSSRYIAAGQGFFIRAKEGATSAVFQNHQRVALDGDNNPVNLNFAKMAESQVMSQEKHRYWLNLNHGDASKQIAIVHHPMATNGFDLDYDSVTLNGNTAMNFYSHVDNHFLVIQGRAPMQLNDQIPLGYHVTSTGNFSISLHAFEGVFNNQDIYLWDKSLQLIHNLKVAPYNFNSVAGTHQNRFEIIYQNSPLNNDKFETTQSIVFVKDQVLFVANADDLISEVTIIDTQGRIISTNKNLNSLSVELPFVFSKGVYFAHIKNENNKTIVQKFVN